MFDKFTEECGIFAISNHADAAKLTVLGLHALQHRGQAAAGIAIEQNGEIIVQKGPGLVLENFNLNNLSLQSHNAIGHTRYPTYSNENTENIQPLVSNDGAFAIAHNGQIVSPYKQKSDSHHIIDLMDNNSDIKQAFVEAINNITGGFAICCLSSEGILAARDPIGIRPLILGKLQDAYVFSSESCALDAIGASFIREVGNCEILFCSKNELIQLQKPQTLPPRLCIFEYIYFARADSHINYNYMYDIRKNMGQILAQEAELKADMVIPVQNSGTYAALGYATELNLPFELAMFTDNYLGRSFIEPNPKNREAIILLKHNVIESVVRNKEIILIDDSLIRGSTIIAIIKKLRKAKAKKIHLLIASPPFKHIDKYGLDIQNSEELLSHQYPTPSALQKYLEVDSLKFLSLDGLYQAICGAPRNKKQPQYTDHYFSGEYPSFY